MIVLLVARFRSRVRAFARSMARCSGSVSAQRERASTGAKDGATCSRTHRGERTRERANARTKTRKPQGNARDSISTQVAQERQAGFDHRVGTARCERGGLDLVAAVWT